MAPSTHNFHFPALVLTTKVLHLYFYLKRRIFIGHKTTVKISLKITRIKKSAVLTVGFTLGGE